MINWIEICGWIGSISYSIYSLPQAIDVFRRGQTEGLSIGMIFLLFFGSLCSFLYIFPDYSSPLFYNFLISLIAISIILKFHFLPRKNK
ncbi:MAG: PQ-loop repeat-containing protein [Alphaproteobacteria bacterium]|nr:PQ-loop repeat-containing protein [Alphaproteobacteria bacterium]